MVARAREHVNVFVDVDVDVDQVAHAQVPRSTREPFQVVVSVSDMVPTVFSPARA